MKIFFNHIFQEICTQNLIFKDVYICFHAHIVYSSLSFFQALIDLGFKKENIFILGKSYSTVPEVASFLKKNDFNVLTMRLPEHWGDYERVANLDSMILMKNLLKAVKKSRKPKIIIMDSGAVLTKAVYNTLISQNLDVVGVELTTQGTYKKYVYPVVEVALSEAKRELESNFIAISILEALNKRGFLKKEFTYGILGCGAIGKNLLHSFKEKGYTAVCYDTKKALIPRIFYRNIGTLLSESDCIIGTTGISSLKKEALDNMKDRVVLVSTSSKDTEFSDFLFDIGVPFNTKAPFSDFIFETKNKKKLIITNGTFPINFDRIGAPNPTGDPEIMLTRGLWLAGLIQAIFTPSFVRPFNLKLKMDYQVAVVENWLMYFSHNFSQNRQKQIKNFLKQVRRKN